jgi:nitric oxide reductase activation protein
MAFDGRLRRPLSRLGLGLELSHRRRQGEDLDIDAAIEARLDMLAGLQPAETVYLESLRRRHELAALVLLDVSGSANEPSVANGTVHEHQLAGAVALTQALHALGNRVAVYGFYSRGRKAVRVVRIKRFADTMNTRVLRRFGALVPGGYTRFGAAIRHGAEILDEEGGGSRRLLIVLSDGFAYDHGYEGRYGEADARRALSEARRRGIGCLCLSISAATDLTALQRVFGSAAHGTVQRADELAHVVGPLLRDALRSAELERGRTQRASQATRRLDPQRRSA